MIRSGFFNSVGGDRKYNAARYAEYFNSFVGNGVFPNPSTGLQVLANGDMTVTVKAGRAWINGYIIVNDDDYILTLDVADGVLKRIDRIVARYDIEGRGITLVVKKGSFASSPVAPALQRDADAYELGLADVYIANGAVSITQSNVTDLRLNATYCGVVTGLITQVDATTLFNQYQAWIAEKKTQYNTDMTTWTATKQQEFVDWANEQQQDYEDWYDLTTTTEQAEIDAMEAAFAADWNDWFATVQGQLSGDIAGHLLTNIETHKDNTTTAHGATSAAAANKIIVRDASGRAKVAAPSAADDIARKDTVDALAGVGNTATVKDLDDSLDEHKADTTQHLSVMTTQGDLVYRGPSAPARLAKGTAGQVLAMNSGATAPEWIPSPTPVDYGRYQSEFGWDGASYSNTALNNNVVNLGRIGTTITLPDANNTSAGITDKRGVIFRPLVNMSAIDVVLYSGTYGVSGVTKAYIQRDYDGVTIATVDVAASPIRLSAELQANTNYRVVVDANGGSYTQAWLNTGVSYPYTSLDGNITAAVTNGTQETTVARNIKSISAAIIPTTSGTVTKTITPSDLKKWGNLKITLSNDDVNNSATVTIKDASGDNVLIAATTLVNGLNLIDLSSISVSSYPSLKTVFILTRNAVSDTSPTVSLPSWTWEGSDDVWEKISSVVLDSNTTQIDLLVPTKYSKVRLKIQAKASSTSGRYIRMRFNNDASVSHYQSCIATDEGTMNATNAIDLYTTSYSAYSLPNSSGAYSSLLDLEIQVDNKATVVGIASLINSSGAFACNIGGLWLNQVDRISTISLIASGDSIASGSKITMWGCK